MDTKRYTFRNPEGKILRRTWAICDRHLKAARPGFTVATWEPTDEHCFKCDQQRKEHLDGIYYNTTHYNGEQLELRIRNARNQDAAILVFLNHYRNDSFTRDEVHEKVLPNAQNTSIGRALNTLMRLGYATKLSEMRDGNMGHQQHLWRLKRR